MRTGWAFWASGHQNIFFLFWVTGIDDKVIFHDISCHTVLISDIASLKESNNTTIHPIVSKAPSVEYLLNSFSLTTADLRLPLTPLLHHVFSNNAEEKVFWSRGDAEMDAIRQLVEQDEANNTSCTVCVKCSTFVNMDKWLRSVALVSHVVRMLFLSKLPHTVGQLQ